MLIAHLRWFYVLNISIFFELGLPFSNKIFNTSFRLVKWNHYPG